MASEWIASSAKGENPAVSVLAEILNNRISGANENKASVNKAVQKPGRCHTRTWFKKEEM